MTALSTPIFRTLLSILTAKPLPSMKSEFTKRIVGIIWIHRIPLEAVAKSAFLSAGIISKTALVTTLWALSNGKKVQKFVRVLSGVG
jgi:hypothetical protein